MVQFILVGTTCTPNGACVVFNDLHVTVEIIIFVSRHPFCTAKDGTPSAKDGNPSAKDGTPLLRMAPPAKDGTPY